MWGFKSKPVAGCGVGSQMRPNSNLRCQHGKLICIFHGGTFDEVKRGFRGARAVPAEPERHAGLLAVNGRVIFYLTDHGIAGRSGQMSTGGRKKALSCDKNERPLSSVQPVFITKKRQSKLALASFRVSSPREPRATREICRLIGHRQQFLQNFCLRLATTFG